MKDGGDHPGTGVWSVVCGYSDVTVSTHGSLPSVNSLFLIGMITIATSVSWYATD